MFVKIKYSLAILLSAALCCGFISSTSRAEITVYKYSTLVLDTANKVSEKIDSLKVANQLAADSIAKDSLTADSTVKPKRSFLDGIITGKNKDSLIYNLRTNKVRIFKEGEINYQDIKLKSADHINIDMTTRDVEAYGMPNDSGKISRPIFVDKESEYVMDTLRYNLKTEKAKIKSVFTKEGEGFLHGKVIKKMPNNDINIAGGKYTTCDAEHPHFYIAMTKAKLIPGKKIVTGPAYFVMEDVPIYFLGLPFAFFPMQGERNSGFIIPSYGEETQKGFFLRDGGYYFAFNDYIDMTVLGGIYTKGSWEASLRSRYIKRYKYSGNFAFNYSKNIVGEKGSADYINSGSYRLSWTHTQDPKFKPNSNFSASVNFSSSGYTKYGSQTMDEYLNTQTNSSISYSKSWPGKPYSFSTNLQHSQNSRDSTISLSLPNVVFNVSKIFPFKRKEAVGKQRWYEKISLSYTGTLANNVTVKEDQLFTEEMFKKMRNGVNHQVPISTSMNILKFLTVSPTANYQERWYFKKVDKEWNPQTKTAEVTDTTYGFYRVYNYNFSMGMSTRIYGMFEFKNPNSAIVAVRHVMTPSMSFSYTPDFGKASYGYYKPIQVDSTGRIDYYSPFEGAMYGVPGRSKSAMLSFSLGNNIEMKVRSKQDTAGVKKIKLLDNLSISSSYNFLADSMNLSPFSVSGRTTLFENFGINFNATFDPYQVNENGTRINKFLIKDGKLARLTNASFSFGYSFNSKGGNRGAMNDINSANPTPPEYSDFFNQNNIDANTQRQLTSTYYEFSIPWNFGFNYSFTYSNNGRTKDVTQTLGFNGSITLSEKWGFSFNAGYDFEMKKITPGTFSLTRDLHCWQMSFQWVPIGFRQSWSFNIGVKSALLQDLKYDKRSSYYDNYYY